VLSFRSALLAGIGMLFLSAVSQAQLISPGKLSNAHSFLNGISNCVQCHEIRNPSISNERCLDCHVPIDSTIVQMRGVHGQPDVLDQNCSNCHQEHFGEEFDVLRFDSAGFDHSITGFELIGAHASAECQDCHGNSDWIRDQTVLNYQEKFGLIGSHSTFLGLEPTCESCHLEESVHGDQFAGESCANCHNTVDWEDISQFDHNEARFALTGLHVEQTCESCHTPERVLEGALAGTEVIRFRGLEFETCESCHEDVHEGRLDELAGVPQTCESCHGTEGWHQFDERFPEDLFPHEETGYALIGAHESLDCESCHAVREDLVIANQWVDGTADYTYPEPVSDTCMDCHVDYHEGVFVHTGDGAECSTCHTETAWIPSNFGLAQHKQRSRFQLTGAHVVTPCSNCHIMEPSTVTGEEKPQFRFDDLSCEGCHEEDNPHGDSFASTEDGCDTCHATTSWNRDITYDHEAETGYALTGAHASLSCQSCHFDSGVGSGASNRQAFSLLFAALPDDCMSCHETDSPHQGQFAESVLGPACEECHTTERFTLDEFDHSRTSFPLDGAHIEVACADCHVQETAADGSLFTRFFPLSTECSACHGDQ
jgi:nitrate/TMAO reductase-like tetraheme cytochrome c subunit